METDFPTMTQTPEVIKGKTTSLDHIKNENKNFQIINRVLLMEGKTEEKNTCNSYGKLLISLIYRKILQLNRKKLKIKIVLVHKRGNPKDP